MQMFIASALFIISAGFFLAAAASLYGRAKVPQRARMAFLTAGIAGMIVSFFLQITVLAQKQPARASTASLIISNLMAGKEVTLGEWNAVARTPSELMVNAEVAERQIPYAKEAIVRRLMDSRHVTVRVSTNDNSDPR